MAPLVTSLRAWRHPAITRRVAAALLFSSAVLTAVLGQSVLVGPVALVVLMLSAGLLAGAVVYLMLAFQGTLSMTALTLLLPGGEDLPLQRVAGARAEGHVLVLDLMDPQDQRRVPTQQPPELVAAFARAVLAARGEEAAG